MYFANILPSLPSEPIQGTQATPVSSRMHSFVDDEEVGHVLHRWSESNWQEQCFIGEDFAGREDCQTLLMQKHEWRPRQELGPFYSNPMSLEAGPTLATCRPSMKASRVEMIIAAERLRRRTMAAAAAAAAILSASVLSVWFPHTSQHSLDLSQYIAYPEMPSTGGEKSDNDAPGAWMDSLVVSHIQSQAQR